MTKFAARSMLCAVVLAGCSTPAGPVTNKMVEADLIASTEKSLPGAKVSDAVCPESFDGDSGDEFTCNLVVDGQDVEFAVTLTDEGYSFDTASDTLSQHITDYEGAVARFVFDAESVDVAVACGTGAEWLFVSSPTSLECAADYGDFDRKLSVSVAADGSIDHIAFSEARLDLGLVTDRVGDYLDGALGGGFVLDCPDTFSDDSVTVALPPGAQFDCIAVRELANVGTVRVVVVDPDGQIAAEVLEHVLISPVISFQRRW